ncbi:ROK family protein [Anaerotignum faecicola]|nr:ROK family protein [Anaerotignum faecicola]
MFYVGVNFDITNIVAAVIDDDGNILVKESAPTLKYRELTEIIGDMAALIEKTVKKAGLDLNKDIEHVGVGCYGTINRETGVLIYSSYFGFRDVPLLDEIKKFIKIPVYIENDANCYALAESRLGATKGLKNSVIVTIGTAMSGGIIINGEVYHGAFYGAGEFGHHVIVLDGEKCECGRNGCWAAYASSTALVRDARIAAIRHPESIMFKMVNGDLRLMSYNIPFDAAKQGDIYAKDVVFQYARYIALGLINIINILQPDAIAIGGKIINIDETFLDTVSELVKEKTFGQKKTKIMLTEMNYDAVLIGAAMLRE